MRRISRRKVLQTLFGLTFFAVLTVGSTGRQVITVAKILEQVSNVVTALELTDQISNSTLASVDSSYNDLGACLREKNFSTSVVESMEQKYNEMNGRLLELKSALNKSNSEANTLFKLLKAKTNENTNPTFKTAMGDQINSKESEFNMRMQVAAQVFSKIEGSVQQYNDILGFLQVTVGLEAVDAYLEQVDLVLVQSESLNADIQKAIEEASEIIKSSSSISQDQNSGSESKDSLDESTTIALEGTELPTMSLDLVDINSRINGGSVVFESEDGRSFTGTVSTSEIRSRQKSEESGVAATIRWNDGVVSSILFMENSRVRVWVEGHESGGSWYGEGDQIFIKMDEGGKYKFY
jgi:hypothetical protein